MNGSQIKALEISSLNSDWSLLSCINSTSSVFRLGTVFELADVYCFTYFLGGFLFRVRGRVRVEVGVGGGFRVRVRASVRAR